MISKPEWPAQPLPPFPALNMTTTALFPTGTIPSSLFATEPNIAAPSFPTFSEKGSAQPVHDPFFSFQHRQGGLLPDDTNFFRCFENDIKRWVAATMSPKNPNSHVPSDEEIQHQARWIMYGGDDSWNQTPADFPEWLWMFKKNMGIVTEPDATAAQGGRFTGQMQGL